MFLDDSWEKKKKIKLNEAMIEPPQSTFSSTDKKSVVRNVTAWRSLLARL